MNPLGKSQYVHFTEVEPDVDWSRYDDFKTYYENGTHDRFQLGELLHIDPLLVGRYISKYKMQKQREVLNKPPRFEMQ